MSIEEVYRIGEDALKTEWEAQFVAIPADIGINNEDFSKSVYRITNFAFPDITVPTYAIHYNSLTYDRPGSKVEHTKELSFNFRIDRNWRLYQSLVLWMNKTISAFNGKAGPDDTTSNLRGGVMIRAKVAYHKADGRNGFNKTEKTPQTWHFDGVYPKSITSLELDYTEGGPVVATALLGYLEVNNNKEK